MKKIGLITMHNVCNIGAVLQAYALQSVLENDYETCEIINYIPDLRRGMHIYFPKEQGVGRIRRIASNLKWLPSRIRWQKPYKEFVNQYLHVSKTKIYSNTKIKDIDFDYDCVVTGSDQVWNPDSTDGFDPFYFLDFYDGPKFSYAASISKKNLSNSEKEWLKNRLDRYSGISVRENSAVSVLQQATTNNIECVLDPTFLLDKHDWERISNVSKINIEDDYLLVYILGNVPKLEELAERIASEKKLKIVKFGWDLKNKSYCHYTCNFGTPNDYVKLFSNAKYVVTNSFHGTAFSINFGIDFSVLPSSPNNPRFLSVLNIFGLQNRIIEKWDTADCSSIDYSIVHSIMNEEIEHSRRFISLIKSQ